VTDIAARLSSALAGRYRIERELGRGGMATVYLADDVRHDRRVALKVLKPELSAILGGERFVAEIKTTANLQHPHILSLFDSGEADGLVFYVMPYVEGESLRERLTREKQLPVDEAVRIATEVASALDYAHRHGVVHRDIKPENVLLHEGQALVADFGIALAASRSEGGTRLTETGMSLGTPHYMAPEQAMGEKEITPKADIYALGCVLYEMLAGEPPFNGPTPQAIIARVMTEAPRSLALQRHTVPAHVEAAAVTALEKLPADRFATAADFADALQGRMARPTTHGGSAALPAAGDRRWRRRFQWSAGVAATALALAVWGWAFARRAESVAWQFVSFGDSVSVNQLGPALTIAPDGAAIVVRDNAQNGRLWLKRRGELTATPIPGTERANDPVFSPDGQWLAFIADGHLKKIRVSGGATITLADSAAAPYGGVGWLDERTLVYVSPNVNELRTVAAAGGASVTVLRDSSGGGLGYPVALPGGRGVLFQNCSSGCVTMGVHVLDLRSGMQKLLVADAAQAWLLPDGRFFYVRRDGVGLVAKFDLGRLEIVGAAAPVLEGVAVVNGGAQLAWSRAGTLLYQAGQSQSDLEVVRVSRSGLATPSDTAWHGAFNSIAVAPDGSRIAVGAGSTSGGLNVWIKQLDRGPFTRLTFSGGDRRPAWSADGRMLAFIRDTAGTGVAVVKAADGSGRERAAVRIDRQLQEVQWSPDGQWLIVRTDNGFAGAGDILAVRADGNGTPAPLAATPFTEIEPALSPDGRWLAYVSNESGTNEVFVRPFPDAATARFQVSIGGGMEPCWSPDARELFFLDAQGRLVAAQVRPAGGFAVTALRPLFDASAFAHPGFHQSYDVARDGRSFFFLRPRQPAAGSQAPQLVRVDHWFRDVRARLAP
jgi:Tol biopolymer transport system component/tRNA A-37 threonylcarbamoyl transferase component Bud32